MIDTNNVNHGIHDDVMIKSHPKELINDKNLDIEIMQEQLLRVDEDSTNGSV